MASGSESPAESSDHHSLIWCFLSASYKGLGESCFLSNSCFVLLRDGLVFKACLPKHTVNSTVGRSCHILLFYPNRTNGVPGALSKENTSSQMVHSTVEKALRRTHGEPATLISGGGPGRTNGKSAGQQKGKYLGVTNATFVHPKHPQGVPIQRGREK